MQVSTWAGLRAWGFEDNMVTMVLCFVLKKKWFRRRKIFAFVDLCLIGNLLKNVIR